MATSTAAGFTAELEELRDPVELTKTLRYFTAGPDEEFIGVRMGSIFTLAKRHLDMPAADLEAMLESPVHEVRVGACSIMGKAAAARTATVERRGELYELYLRRSDRVNNWDLVDLAARDVLGGWLADKPRDPLYRLARSSFWPDRRSALLATAWFIRAGDVNDALALSELLVADPEPLVTKAAGWMLRYAGDSDRPALLAFLDAHAGAMPRVMLSNALEHLDAAEKAHYRSLPAS
ncbi:DNA alkylation repair protein [Leifsonia sp. Root60]|uniref:DNA alkylation repair protein n=2 Tax=unclassified Leifsonia TaxID=2663824 RepID=UPI0006F4934A|nr:DNA alkylation repair protein [Leifsonia sp. Root60]KQX07558.1 DNA alkylation repair protein [Leifsonia sp. Root1293]KRA11840.1 DNA alkylation repair protein [Leifsonia sp. Root60]